MTPISTHLPAKDAAELLEKVKDDLAVQTAPDTGKHESAMDIDGIYIGLMPDSAQDSNDETVIDVTEVTEELGNYGSNIPTDRAQKVAVNIYYGLEKIDYMDLIERTIESYFLSANWELKYSAPHSPDPDTGQETKIYQFARTIDNDYERKNI